MEKSQHRHDISDKAWAILEPMLPGQRGQWGGIAEDNRRFINGVFWIIRTGAPWHPPAPERDDPGMDAARRAESERLLPAAVSAFWMARAFCPVLSALYFQALCSSCRHLILGTKKGHFFFSEEMS